MVVLSQAPGGALLAIKSSSPTASSFPLKFSHRKPPLIFTAAAARPSNCNNNIFSKRRRLYPALAKPEGGLDTDSTSAPTNNSTPTPSSSVGINDTVFVGPENVPLEGVIQFDKPNSSSSSFTKWGRIGLLAGGDVLALLVFSAIGRFSHGFSVFDFDTLRTADPFIAGWFLGAYFLGGYGEDGRGINGLSNAVVAAAKSWALGIPVGVIIRAVTSGHVPPYTFIFVTMGTTAVLLIGWRTLLISVLPKKDSNKNDVFRRGSPFELFELLTSLVRRW